MFSEILLLVSINIWDCVEKFNIVFFCLQEYLEMQRQLALQRLQEQEREMQMRFEQQRQLTQMRQMQNYGYNQVGLILFNLFITWSCLSRFFHIMVFCGRKVGGRTPKQFDSR